MARLLYQIAAEVFQQQPAYARGVLVFDSLDNSQAPGALDALLRQAEAAARAAVPGNPAEFPPVAAWREAYRRFGAKPAEHRSAIEALLRRVLKPDQLPSVNPLVDIGNLVSLRHFLPAGVHPLGAQDTSLQLRCAQAGDSFLPAEGSAAETVPAGEVVLARGHEVLTRRWTWRQAAGTRIDSRTSRVFVNIDGLPPIGREQVLTALHSVAQLVAEYCGGRLLCSTVLDSAQPRLDVTI